MSNQTPGAFFPSEADKQQPTYLTVEEAEKLLNEFSCLDMQSIYSPEEKTRIRQALLLLTNSSDYQMLGVCAASLEEGLAALASYLEALGYKKTILDDNSFKSIEGSVYIKFNGIRESCHLDSYNGKYRGVLVSCQSSEGDGVNGTYGHLPLDLFTSDNR